MQDAINTIFMLIDSIQSSWSDSKWKSVQAYDSLGTYEKASKTLDMSFQAISQNCKSAKFDIIKESEQTVISLLTEVIKDDDLFTDFF